jgi:hypothetical protein
MRTINSKLKYRVGMKVIVIRPYVSNSANLIIGNVGIIKSVSLYDLPDFGLYNLKAYEIDFFSCTVSFGEAFIKEYVRPA